MSFASQFALVLLGVGLMTALVAGAVAWVETQNGHDQQLLAAGAGVARLEDSLLRIPTSQASQQLACELSRLPAVVQGFRRDSGLASDAAQAVATSARGQSLVLLGTRGQVLAAAPAGSALLPFAASLGRDPLPSCASPSGFFARSGSALLGAGEAQVTLDGTPLGRVVVLTPLSPAAITFITAVGRTLGPRSQAFVEVGGRLVLPARVRGRSYPAGGRLPAALQPSRSGNHTWLSGSEAVSTRGLPSASGGRVATLVVTQSVLSARPTAQQLAVPLALAVAAVLLLGMVVALLLAEHFLSRPLRRLDQAVQRLAQDAYAQPIQVDGAEEITRLGANFEIMRRHLRRQLVMATGRTVIANTLTTNGPLDVSIAQVLQSLVRLLEAGSALVLVRPLPPMSDGLLVVVGLRGDQPTYTQLISSDGLLGQLGRESRFTVRDVLAPDERGSFEQRHGVRSLLAEPLRERDRDLGVLLVLNKREPYTEEDSTLCATVAEQLVAAVQKSVRLQETQREATTDAMTGLYNYRFLASYLDQQVNVADRAATRLSVLMLDLDLFKAVNDTHGHPAGDQVLRTFAATLVDTLRKSDLAARYGGEEFVVVMANTGREEAELVAEKIRAAVENMRVVLPDGTEIQLTVSIGGITFPEGSRGARNLLDLSDRALYTAKHKGRNRVEFFSPPPPAAPD